MAGWKFWQKKEVTQRSRRSYQAAKINRLVADWVTSNASVDSEIRGAIKQIRARSRDLARNNDYVKAFLRELQVNVIGKGIPFQSQVRMDRANKLNEAVNTEIESAWQQWSKKSSCHTAGKLAFQDIESLIIREMAEGGDVYIRMVPQKFGNSKIPLGLEIIEAEMLDEEYNGRSIRGNEIRMGVEFDDWGRPLYYYFLTRHPNDFLFHSPGIGDKHVVVDAKDVIPLFLPERNRQTRGVPWVVSTMMKLHHLGGYEESEVIAARATSALMGFIETPEGELNGDDVEGDQRVTEFEPGVFKQLNPGEKVNVPDLKRPGGQFDPFVRVMLRAMASGTGASYESISSDFSQTNYSSSRQALLKERDFYRMIQDFIIRNFHQVVFERWLDLAVLSGALNLKNYFSTPEKYTGVRWMPRGWSWIDPLKEIQAAKEALKANLTTQSQILAEQGLDFEEVLMQRKREIELAQSLGVPSDLSVEMTTQVLNANDPQSANSNQ